VFALILTGPPGAGKTAVLEALTDALSVEDVRHATVEVEALTSAHPPLDDDQWPAPVEAVCGLYRRFGYELLLVTATVESDGDLRGVLAAIGADEHVAVRLHAEPSTLRWRSAPRMNVPPRSPSGSATHGRRSCDRAEPGGRRAVDSASAPRDTGAHGDGQRRAGAVEL
jgi:hypothetical protein